MLIRRLWLRDFRSYGELDLSFTDGTCVILGPNGVGKSNLLEAIGYAAQLDSFRSAPIDAMIRRGADSAVVRAQLDRNGREALVEAEINRSGRNRVLLNRQRLARTSDLTDVVLVTAFAPTDLELIKGGPGLRRSLIDGLVVSVDSRNEPVKAGFERSLRQRNALLKQVRGRLDTSASATLDVWDHQLADSGERLSVLRQGLIDDLTPLVTKAYRDIAGYEAEVVLHYASSWRERGLKESLVASREDDLRRGVTLVGPHRDDVTISLGDMPARTHASQGEQRTLALALRVAGHRLLAGIHGSSPILLLDDVFSELDDNRAEALLASLPDGQRILTTATEPPSTVHTNQLLMVAEGTITERTL